MLTLLLPLLLSSAPALAQELPTTNDAEALARLQAIRAYKAHRLQVKAYTEMSGGGTSMSPGLGVGGVQIMSDPIRTVHTWGIFQGPIQVDMPTFYTITGNQVRADELSKKIQTYRYVSTGLYAGALIGGITAAFGLYSSIKDDSLARGNGGQVALVGAISGLACLSLAGLPAAKADSLKNDPSATLTPVEAQALADSYNERLRRDLTLSAEDAARIELGQTQ